MEQNKYAVLSMDIEDWYHLDYFQGKKCDKNFSMLDGFYNYLELLDTYNIKTTFFVLSELIDQIREPLLIASKSGHEIACHGKTHTRPLLLSVENFRNEIYEAKNELSDLIGKEVIGYRAPCYSIDKERYDVIKDLGFKYSSSRMNIPGHPLYENLNIDNYLQPILGVYNINNFYEFELSTNKFLRKSIAVSGGGWIRLFPWKFFMKPLINNYINKSSLYTLYIHPFELSNKKMPFVNDCSILTNFRAHKGLGSVNNKILELINLLNSFNYKFYSFQDLVFLQSKNNNNN